MKSTTIINVLKENRDIHLLMEQSLRNKSSTIQELTLFFLSREGKLEGVRTSYLKYRDSEDDP